MGQVFIDSHKFDKTDFRINPLKPGAYESCIFSNCDFSNADLSVMEFVECEFTSCNLSMVKIVKTVFRDARFRGCKMLGLRFDTCNEFGMTFGFENCTLDHSTFFETKIRKTVFKDSHLFEVDFSKADLSGSAFKNCDLSGATFDNTILDKSDFRTSYNFTIDPENNRIKKARFSLIGVPGLLAKYDIEIDN